MTAWNEHNDWYLKIDPVQCVDLEKFIKLHFWGSNLKRILKLEGFGMCRFNHQSNKLVDKIISFIVKMPDYTNVYGNTFMIDPVQTVSYMDRCWKDWRLQPKDEDFLPNIVMALRRPWEEKRRISEMKVNIAKFKLTHVDQEAYFKRRAAENAAEPLYEDDSALLHDSDYEDSGEELEEYVPDTKYARL